MLGRVTRDAERALKSIITMKEKAGAEAIVLACTELELVVDKGVLSVRGEKAGSDDRKYLHQGIANRAFERKFNLADHVEITGADLKNGLLSIHLVKEIPEEMKPKTIQISQDDSVIEHDRVEHDEAANSKAA